jgi:hypothetical protein
MRRDDICLYLGPADRAQLQALLTDRNTARKVVWRAEIVLVTADGCGTVEIMRRANTSKPTVWRWQARFLDEGVDGLRRDTETRARHRFERRVEGGRRASRRCHGKRASR